MTFPNRAARTQAKQNLAKTLRLPVRQVSRLKLCEKPLESVLKREKKARKAAEHREKCKETAEICRNGQISIKKAAEQCGISERQMARYVATAQKEQPCSEMKAGNSPAP